MAHPRVSTRAARRLGSIRAGLTAFALASLAIARRLWRSGRSRHPSRVDVAPRRLRHAIGHDSAARLLGGQRVGVHGGARRPPASAAGRSAAIPRPASASVRPICASSSRWPRRIPRRSTARSASKRRTTCESIDIAYTIPTNTLTFALAKIQLYVVQNPAPGDAGNTGAPDGGVIVEQAPASSNDVLVGNVASARARPVGQRRSATCRSTAAIRRSRRSRARSRPGRIWCWRWSSRRAWWRALRCPEAPSRSSARRRCTSRLTWSDIF